MRKIYLVFLAVVLSGCGSNSPMVPVSGIVKLDGQPLVNASVSFVPQGNGKQATGTTDEKGKFVLSTIDPRDGAMPGTYKVVIAPNTAASDIPEGLSASEAMEADAAAAAKGKKTKGAQVPEAYSRSDKTTLTQEVPSKGEVVFDLKSK